MFRRRLVLAVLVLLGMLTMTGGQLLAAPPVQEAQALIVSPAAGSVVNGSVDIIGTASHPTITAYEIFYAEGSQASGSSDWKSILRVENSPIENDVLAAWDTTPLPDGVYTLAISVWWGGGGQVVRFANNITVKNEGVTPTPTNTPLPTAGALTPTPVPVDMPPTFTPPPTSTPPPGETPVVVPEQEEEEGATLAFDSGQLRSAFFRGMRITLFLFFLWGGYILVKAVIRYYLRTGGGSLGKR